MFSVCAIRVVTKAAFSRPTYKLVVLYLYGPVYFLFHKMLNFCESKKSNGILRFQRFQVEDTVMLRYIISLMVLLFFSLSCRNNTKQNNNGTTDRTRPWKLICMGDDWTIGTGLAPDFAYPARLANQLATTNTVKVVNAGMKGEPLKNAVSRIDWILQQRMDAFLLAYGKTDEELSISIEEQLQGWRALLTKLRNAYPTLPILVFVTGNNNRNESYQARLKSLLKEYDARWVNVVLPTASAAPQHWDEKGENLSKEGQQLLTEGLLPIVLPILTAAPDK